MLSLGQRALWRLQALYAIWRIIFSNLVIAVQRIVSECKFASSARQRVSVVIWVPLTMITGSDRIVLMRPIHVFYLTIGVIMAAAFLGHKLGRTCSRTLWCSRNPRVVALVSSPAHTRSVKSSLTTRAHCTVWQLCSFLLRQVFSRFRIVEVGIWH